MNDYRSRLAAVLAPSILVDTQFTMSPALRILDLLRARPGATLCSLRGNSDEVRLAHYVNELPDEMEDWPELEALIAEFESALAARAQRTVGQMWRDTGGLLFMDSMLERLALLLDATISARDGCDFSASSDQIEAFFRALTHSNVPVTQQLADAWDAFCARGNLATA